MLAFFLELQREPTVALQFFHLKKKLFAHLQNTDVFVKLTKQDSFVVNSRLSKCTYRQMSSLMHTAALVIRKEERRNVRLVQTAYVTFVSGQ